MAQKKNRYITNTTEVSNEWYAKPGKHKLSRLSRIIQNASTRQQQLVANNTETQTPDYSIIYGYDEDIKSWVQMGYKCLNCAKVLKDLELMSKHPIICSNVLKINRDEETQILDLVRKHNDAS